MLILFIDIETAHEIPKFPDLSEDGQAAWKRKFNRFGPMAAFETAEDAYVQAPLFAEFARIVCISVGKVLIDPRVVDYDPKQGPNLIQIKAITGTEEEILSKFATMIEKNKPDALCAHNGKSFDYPFMTRRYIIKRLPVPEMLQIEGKKPWETFRLIDTMELWKFGDLKYYSSLIVLAYVFGVPSPKGDMDGSMVSEAFHAGKIEDIAKYCNQDVLTLICVWRRWKGEKDIENTLLQQ